MKIDIKNRYNGKVLFSHETENNTLRLTLEAAVKAKTNLTGAYLARANLTGANLTGAYLAEADLAEADLAEADLTEANLTGANLTGANLAEAYLAEADLTEANLVRANIAEADLDRTNLARINLAGADLTGTNLTEAKLLYYEVLIGERPVIQIGPIGSREDYLVAYITDQGLRFDAGCQRQISRNMLEARIHITHGTNKHAQEYRAAIAFAEAHYEIWKTDYQG